MSVERVKGRRAIITSIILGTAVLSLLCLAVWRLRVIVSSPVERPPIDFEAIERTGKPNDYLVCPPDFCSSVPDEFSPVFEMPASHLQKEWLAVIRNQPRIESFQGDDDSQLQFVQRTGLMNFPDLITVRFYNLAEECSTLAVYSRSQYGYSDLGVNRKRVQSWLSELQRRLSAGRSTGR